MKLILTDSTDGRFAYEEDKIVVNKNKATVICSRYFDHFNAEHEQTICCLYCSLIKQNVNKF